MSWLKEAASSPQSGRVSSSRVVALAAGLTLSVCTLVLTPLAFLKPDLTTALTVFGTALAGLAGSGYVANKIVSKKETAAGEV